MNYIGLKHPMITVGDKGASEQKHNEIDLAKNPQFTVSSDVDFLPKVSIHDRDMHIVSNAMGQDGLEGVEIAGEFVLGNLQYAEHLLKHYPESTHKILTRGQQCFMTNAFLELMLPREECLRRVYQRPVNGLYILGRRDAEYCNNVLSKIIPSKEQLGDKKLVISRNLALMETMNAMLGILENYFQSNGIDYVFDFTVGEEAVNDAGDNLARLQSNKRVNIAIMPTEYQKMDDEEYQKIRELDVGMYNAVHVRELLKNTGSTNLWQEKSRHDDILVFALNRLKQMSEE
ncbi:hypothetical protein [Kistimonas asteriae]|uniref:hypothetical protein n=1 Tax=Kistimonas asteriae TaxID=517724 RepID=UPI001BA754E7|nr:hypothetical protein [Kistimonas asteriae]